MSTFSLIRQILIELFSKKLAIGVKYINKRIRLYVHETKCFSNIICQEEKILAVTFLYKFIKVHTAASAYVITVYEICS